MHLTGEKGFGKRCEGLSAEKLNSLGKPPLSDFFFCLDNITFQAPSSWDPDIEGCLEKFIPALLGFLSSVHVRLGIAGTFRSRKCLEV